MALFISVLVFSMFYTVKCDSINSILNPCDPNPCQHSGECHRIDLKNYLCECPERFWGRDCEFETGQQPCKNHQCHRTASCRPDASRAMK